MTDTLPSPDVLTYRFHQFRPSDRDALRGVLSQPQGDAVFLRALERYLDTWAEGTWLQEYDIEVIAEWCAIHARQLLPGLDVLAQNKMGGPGQALQVYGVFRAALLQPGTADVRSQDQSSLPA